MRTMMLSLAIGTMVAFTAAQVAAQGMGQGAGRGPGQGGGWGAGQGAGQGAGRGAGQGAGRGAGQGAGRGAGQGARDGSPQRGQGLGQNQGDQLTLVNHPRVQAELRLNSDQVQRLRELTESEPARRAAQMLAERGSCERTDERREVMSQVREEIADILDETQWERLNQIWVQVRGVRALQSERIAKKLELTSRQRKEIGGLLSGGFLGRGDEITAQAMEVLNEDQKKKFTAMKGAEFRMQAGGPGAGGGAGAAPRDGRGRAQTR